MSHLSNILNVIAGSALLALGYSHYRTTLKLKQLRKSNSDKSRMSSELQLASQIQQNMMPLGHRAFDNVDVFGTLLPAREMGGDLFDHMIRDGKFYFCIGDVCGKGVPAAMFISNPARIIRSLNDVASKDNVSCSFLTLFYGVLDLQSGHLQYCNAGHNPPYILSDKPVRLACDSNQPVGPLEDVEFTLQETTLSPGSTIFLYTDGLTEANNTKEEQFGHARTQKVLEDCVKQQLKPEGIVNTVKEAVHQFALGAQQSDDLTLLAIRFR